MRVSSCRFTFMKIAIVGLGYVGLPLSLQFARSGVQVSGWTMTRPRSIRFNAGRSYIKHIEAAAIAEGREDGAVLGVDGFSAASRKSRRSSSACRRR